MQAVYFLSCSQRVAATDDCLSNGDDDDADDSDDGDGGDDADDGDDGNGGDDGDGGDGGDGGTDDENEIGWRFRSRPQLDQHNCCTWTTPD